MAKQTPLQIRAVTWKRDSHGLFDYESKQVSCNTMAVTRPLKLVRLENDVQTAELGDSIKEYEEEAISLLKVEFVEGHAVMSMDTTSSEQPERLWRVVRNITNSPNGYKLCAGDVLKLGRVRVKVKELYSGAGDRQVQQPTSSNVPMDLDDIRRQPSNTQFPCRICYSETYSYENPLVTPCKCAGTMRYIHIECLQEWMKSKVKTRESGCTVSYQYANINCETCKEPMPTTVSIEGKLIHLITYTTPDSMPYVVLETMTKDRDQSKVVHVLSMLDQTKFRVGRGHECEVRFQDISISRYHAYVKFAKSGAWYIDDNNSKFGTVVQVKRPVMLGSGHATTLQVNRTVLTFEMQGSWLAKCCACLSKKQRVVPELGDGRVWEDDENSIDSPAVLEMPSPYEGSRSDEEEQKQNFNETVLSEENKLDDTVEEDGEPIRHFKEDTQATPIGSSVNVGAICAPPSKLEDT